ncbi:MAG: hypothetical protein ACRYF4_02800 [Janthinobacterium lividum]
MQETSKVTATITAGRARWQQWSQWLDTHTLTRGQLLGCLLLAAALLILRRPGAFFHAQFYAEDGHDWYAQAYNLGWLRSLTLPDAGYLNTLPRLGAGAALLAPFRWAPLVTVLFGLFVQCLPVAVLLSARARPWGTLSTRAIFAAVYVLSPNAGEIHVVLTNTQWHLSLVALLLALCEPPRGIPGALGDVACLAIAGLSGPFSLLLTPVIVLCWWLRRHPWTAVLSLVMGACALVEVHAILATQSVRYQGLLGPSVGRLLRMVGADVVSASLLGANVTHAFHLAWGHFVPATSTLAMVSLLWLAPLALLGLSVLGYVSWQGSLALRMFILYAGLLLAASLRSPLIAGRGALWELMITTTHGRYWFTPMIALLWSTVWCARFAKSSGMQRTAAAMLCCLPIGMLLDYHYRAQPNYHLQAEVETVRQAAPGTRVTFLIPPGHGWDVTLIKRGAVGTIDH